MVLLFRALSNVELYEAAFVLVDWIITLSAAGRSSQQEICDLLNLLLLENPQDALSLAGALRAPFCCLSDEALFVLARHSGVVGRSARRRDLAAVPADQRERVGRARDFLERWQSLKDRLPIALLLAEIFVDCGYDAATQFEFLGDRKLANLWKLRGVGAAFDRCGLFGLADFIDRLGELVRPTA